MYRHDCFFPLAFDDSGQIQQCVFTEQFRKGQKIYTRLEVHTLQGEQIRITNRAFVATNVYSLGSEIGVNAVDRWSELMPEAVLEGAIGFCLGILRYHLQMRMIREAHWEYPYIPERWS